MAGDEAMLVPAVVVLKRPRGRPPKDPAKRAARLAAMLEEAAKAGGIPQQLLAGEVSASLVTSERKRRGRPPKHVKLVRLAQREGKLAVAESSTRENRKKQSAGAPSSGEEASGSSESSTAKAERSSRRRAAPIEPIVRPKRIRRAPKWAIEEDAGEELVPSGTASVASKASPVPAVLSEEADHVSDSEIEDLHADEDEEEEASCSDSDESAKDLLSLASFSRQAAPDAVPPSAFDAPQRRRLLEALHAERELHAHPIGEADAKAASPLPLAACGLVATSSPSAVTRTMKRSDSWMRIALVPSGAVSAF